jgi:hypothetical protein
MVHILIVDQLVKEHPPPPPLLLKAKVYYFVRTKFPLVTVLSQTLRNKLFYHLANKQRLKNV